MIPYQGQPWLGCRVAATGYSRTAALSVTPPLSALILLSEKRQNVQGCTGLDFKIHTLVTVDYRNTWNRKAQVLSVHESRVSALLKCRKTHFTVLFDKLTACQERENAHFLPAQCISIILG